ncbi:MAG: SdpI family protein [Pseudomonadota bacterium]
MIRTGLIWSSGTILLMLAGSLYARGALPADGVFPIQWGVDGEPNRFATRSVVIFGLPLMAAAISAAFALAPIIDPRRDNLEKSKEFFLTGWIGGILIIGLAHAVIIASAMTGATPGVDLILIGSAAFVGLAGNLMAKSKSNYFAGLRTPWTLSSDRAWSVGNRICGWGFVLSSVLMIAIMYLVDREIALKAMLAGLAASVVVGTLASYFAWRGDPQRAR